jgi:hypothetical protein
MKVKQADRRTIIATWLGNASAVLGLVAIILLFSPVSGLDFEDPSLLAGFGVIWIMPATALFLA